jgi:ribosome-interacting GTPase 1
VISVNSFCEDIEDLVWSKDVSYIDAIVMYCESNSVDIEQVANLIKKDNSLLEKIEAEAVDLRILEKRAKLPL